jgi:elongation factor Ts
VSTKVSTEKLKVLREQSGASVMACRDALIQAEENMEKAIELLKQKGLSIVEKKKERSTSQGIIESYVHAGGKIGVIVELNCETDFVARTDEFKQLAHNIAMQVAAMYPKFVSKEHIPAGAEVKPEEVCLLIQPYIKDLTKTVQDVINEVIAKVGENVRVSRFVRFELGEQ